MVDRLEVTPTNIKEAIRKIRNYRLGERLEARDGSEAHQILSEIWPVIQELRLLTDACESGKIQPTD